MIKNINYHIIPECYLDTNLVETLVPPQKMKGSNGYNHQHSCNKVIGIMMGGLKDNFALGVVDKDKRKLEHTDSFQLVSTKYNLELYHEPNTHHYLIFHLPLEQWIFNQASELNISLEAYNLPNTLKELTKLSKRESIKTDWRFKKLFKDLQENNAQGIKLLFKWTDYLIKHNYKADKTILINIGNEL